jgi:hypothetical protein
LTEENPLKGKRNFSDFIYTKPEALDKDFCENVIEKFNGDPNVGDDNTVSAQNGLSKRKSLWISRLEDWKEEDEVFHKVLNENLQEYTMVASSGIYNDFGYKIAYQDPDGFYHWHHDAHWQGEWCRVLSFLWYLNSATDGYTEFFEGTIVYPQAGKLLMFPANQVFCHRSARTKKGKFICTGWIYEKRDK